MVVTQRALALELGVDESRVSQYVRRGMPRVPGGVERDVALEWIRKNILPQGGRNSRRGAAHVHAMRHAEDQQLDPAQERAHRDHAATRKLELENAVREGQLVAAEEVRATWQRVVGLIRTSLLGMPSKLAARLAGKSAADIQGILHPL
jgi:phage terminase Nu1 subunit (DNA packaging protein)